MSVHCTLLLDWRPVRPVANTSLALVSMDLSRLAFYCSRRVSWALEVRLAASNRSASTASAALPITRDSGTGQNQFVSVQLLVVAKPVALLTRRGRCRIRLVDPVRRQEDALVARAL